MALQYDTLGDEIGVTYGDIMFVGQDKHLADFYSHSEKELQTQKEFWSQHGILTLVGPTKLWQTCGWKSFRDAIPHFLKIRSREDPLSGNLSTKWEGFFHRRTLLVVQPLTNLRMGSRLGLQQQQQQPQRQRPPPPPQPQQRQWPQQQQQQQLHWQHQQ